MATLTDGNYLNRFVAPQLLQERRDMRNEFLAVLGKVPAQAVTADGINYNKLINNVGFLVNNSADFTAKSMQGKKLFVPWERYDTEPTSVSDEEMQALPFDKRNEVRTAHNVSFNYGIKNHALNKLAPADSTVADMPVMRTTGASDATGRKRLTFADLANYREKIKKLNLPDMDGLYIVLCPEHVTDLILDKDAATYFSKRELYIDPISGKVQSFMGFKFMENNNCPLYTSAGVKKPTGSIAATGDQAASVFFYAPNTLYHLKSVKILYSPETQDTKSASPTSIFRTQTYGLVDRIEDYGVGAIVSANA